MTNIEQKALELVNEEIDRDPTGNGSPEYKALCRAIEQHEAFRQEVSNEMLEYSKWCQSVGLQFPLLLDRFIITKPDPLVEVIAELGMFPAGKDNADQLRAALANRGLEIREKGK